MAKSKPKAPDHSSLKSSVSFIHFEGNYHHVKFATAFYKASPKATESSVGPTWDIRILVRTKSGKSFKSLYRTSQPLIEAMEHYVNDEVEAVQRLMVREAWLARKQVRLAKKA